jgi:hypothetical protein
MPVGLRVQALFSAIVGGVSYGNDAGMETASFRIMIYQYPEDAFYAGPSISGEAGAVSYLRFGPASDPWLTIGALDGPVQFTYTDLVEFHGQAAAAAAALTRDDHLIGSSHGDYMEGYGGDDLLDGAGEPTRSAAAQATTHTSSITRTTALLTKPAAGTTSSRQAPALRWRPTRKSKSSKLPPGPVLWL